MSSEPDRVNGIERAAMPGRRSVSDIGERPARRTGRRLFGLLAVRTAILVLLTIGTAILAERAVLQIERASIRDQVQRDVGALRAEMERLLTADIQIARALVAYIRTSPNLSQAEFQTIAPYLIESSSGAVRTIALAQDLTISHTYPLEPNASTLGFAYRASDSQWPMVAEAVERDAVTLDGPLDLIQGGRGLIVRLPVFLNGSRADPDSLWGIASLVIDETRFLQEVGAADLARDYHLAIFGEEAGAPAERPFFVTATPPGDAPVTVPVAINGRSWQIAATPAEGWPTLSNFSAPIGLLALLFLGAFGYMGFAQTRAERQLVHQSIALDEARREEAKARQAAEAANHSKTLFLANMSHELRTPLNAIIGFTEVMRGEMLGPVGTRKYLEYLKDISDASGHLLSVLGDILDIARVEVGRIEMVESRLSVPSLMEGALSLTAEAADARHQTIAATVPDGLPAVRVDARLMRQVLINLITNAIKHTPPGTEITLGADLRRATSGGQGADRVVLWVADNGPGLPPGIGDRILEPFVRGHEDPFVSADGAGLGLAIAARIMGLHDGELSIDTTHERGTKIDLILPGHRIAPNPPREITDGTTVLNEGG